VNGENSGIRRAAVRVLVGCIAAFALAISLAMPAGATDAFPTTNDHSTQTATGWWWYYGQTAAQVGALVNQNNARLTQVRVEDPNVPTFAVTMVANSGDYGSGWWWFFGQTAAQVSSLLTQNNARLISIDPYQTAAGLRFAVVMVPNTGPQGRAWWWYFGQTSAQVSSLLTQNNAQLTALRPYMDNGQRLFAVIMVSNTGVDSKNWQWWINASPSDVSSHTNDVNNPMRVTELAPDPLGGFDVILNAAEGETWYWYFGVSPQTIGNNVSSHGTRLIDLSSYVVNGTRQYTEVELGNTNPGQAPINSESTRVQNFADANGWAGGYHGAYFVSSAPGSAPSVAVNSNFRYEPASSIKVLYLLYTLQQGVSLNSPITYYWTNANAPNPNACPADVPETAANAHTTTIGTALAGMMQQSNNVYTRAFAIRWGLPAVQAMATSLGMSSTHLSQPFIGCGFRGVAGGVRNELTLADAARLYAAVSNGSALSGAARTTFFNTLLGGPASVSDPWGQVVTQEAAAQGKSGIVSQFLAQLNVRSKGGSYGICLADCNTYKDDLSLTGWVSVPFMSGGVVSPQTYEFGDFVNDLIETCSNCAASNNALSDLNATAAEAARSTIRQALATW
jgi:hypothetical protein